MKKILILLVFVAFSLKAISQEIELPKVKSLSSLNSKSTLNSKHSLSLENHSLSKNLLKKKEIGKTNPQKKPSDFRFDIIPYFWAAGVAGQVSIPGIPQPYPQTYDFNVSFSQVWKNIHFGFMIGGNFRYKEWALLYDIVYVNLKGFNASRQNSDSIFSANTTNKEVIMDYALSYFVPMKTKTIYINPYAGVRIFSVESEITLIDNVADTTVMASGSFTWVDPIIGLNAELEIAPLYSYYKIDLGGFGINSHFAINFVSGLGYRFSRNWDTSLGYKFLGTNYHKKNIWDVGQGGLILTLGYRYL